MRHVTLALLLAVCIGSLAAAVDVAESVQNTLQAHDASEAMVLDSSTWCGCQGCPCPSACGCSACPCDSTVAPQMVDKLPPRCECTSDPCDCPRSPVTFQSRVPMANPTPNQMNVSPLIVKNLDLYMAGNGTKAGFNHTRGQPHTPTYVPPPKLYPSPFTPSSQAQVQPAAPTIPPAANATAAQATPVPARPPAPAQPALASNATAPAKPAAPAPTKRPVRKIKVTKPKPTRPKRPSKKPKPTEAPKKKAPKEDGADKELPEGKADEPKKVKKSTASDDKPKKKKGPSAEETLKKTQADLKKKHDEEANKEKVQKQKDDDRIYKQQQEAEALERQLKAAVAGKPAAPVPKTPPPKNGMLKLQESQSPFGQGFLAPSFQLLGNWCALGGMARVAKTENNPERVMAVLPGNCRPANRLILDNHQFGVKTTRLDIVPKHGHVRVIDEAYSSNSWLSFSGIVPVSTAPVTAVALNQPWRNLGGKYGNLSLSKEGDLCALTGVVSGEDVVDWASTLIAVIPEASGCRPQNGRLVFLVNQNRHSHRIDVLTSGEVRWMSGKRDQSTYFLSLDGIVWSGRKDTDGLNLQSLHNGWTNMDGGYRKASAESQGGYCVLSGMVKNPGGNGNDKPVLKLGKECRPPGRLVFATASSKGAARFDVFADGTVQLIDILEAPTASLIETESEEEKEGESEGAVSVWCASPSCPGPPRPPTARPWC